MSVREDIRQQIISALKEAKFPIGSTEELLAAFPKGADTVCCSGDLRVTAGEAVKLLKAEDFPFNNAGEVADTIVDRAGLK
ncbi:MTH865 family protein [Moorellaceae bacterium AZ2]